LACNACRGPGLAAPSAPAALMGREAPVLPPSQRTAATHRPMRVRALLSCRANDVGARMFRASVAVQKSA
jgi:hypothetical protein